MKNNQSPIKNIEQLLLNRKQNIDQKMSHAIQIKIEKKIADKLRSYKCEMANKNKLSSVSKIFENYLCLLQNIMKKKTLVGLIIGTMLIAAAVWLNSKPQTTEKLSSLQTAEIDSLLTYANQSSNNAEAAIKNFDDIDENLDNEKTLAMTIDSLVKETEPQSESEPTSPFDASPSDAKTAPPDDAAAAPETVNIITSDLDAMMGEIDSAQNAANNSISDLDSIDESEDKVNI